MTRTILVALVICATAPTALPSDRDGNDPYRAERDRVIQHLQSVTTNYPDDPRIAGFHVRLAELLFERARSRALDQLDAGSVKADYSGAREIYELVVDRYPGTPEMAAGLYGRAYCFAAEGRTEKALAAYRQLLAEAPDSPYVPEAHFRIGEFLFDTHKLEDAVAAYRNLLSYPTHALYEEALYKLAWTYYRLSSYEQAIAVFNYLVDEPSDDTNLTSSMVDEAKTYIAISFSEFADVDRLQDYLRAIGNPRYGTELVLSLAGLFRGSGKWEDAEDAYLSVIERFPEAEMAPEAYTELAAMYSQFDRGEEAIALRQRFDEDFGSGTHWQDKWRSTPTAPRVLDESSEHLYAVAAHRHEQARIGIATWDAPLLLYQRFLEAYPKSKRRLSAMLQLADVQRESGDLLAGADSHFRASEWMRSETEEDRGRSADTFYDGLRLLDQAADGDPIALDEFVKQVGIFEAEFENDPRQPRLATRLGGRLHEFERYEAAAQVFMRAALSSDPPEHAAESAANSHFSGQRYLEAEEWAKVAIGGRDLSEEPESLQALLLSSIYRQGEEKRASGDPSGAARDFVRMVDLLPSADGADAAIYDAGGAYLEAALPDSAIGMFERLARAYPGSEWTNDALRRASLLHHEAHRPERAARLLARLADRLAGTPAGDDPAFFSAVYFEEAGESEDARMAFERYRQRYGRDAQRHMHARLREIALVESIGGSINELVKAGYEALTSYQDAGIKIGSPILAELEYRVVGPDHARYIEYEIRDPLEKTTKRKEEWMTNLVDRYMRSAEHAITPWSFRALAKAGEAIEDFRRALLDSPMPSELTEMEVALYQMQLEDYAAPYATQAIETYAAAMEIAGTAGLSDPVVQLAENYLSDHAPAILQSIRNEEALAAERALVAVAAPEAAMPLIDPAVSDAPEPAPTITGQRLRWDFIGGGAASSLAALYLGHQGNGTTAVVLGAAGAGALAWGFLSGGPSDAEDTKNADLAHGDAAENDVALGLLPLVDGATFTLTGVFR